MKQFVTRVTVTGADDSVQPQQLLEIAKEYPFVEFGILISRNSMGMKRFPSKKWINILVDIFLGRDTKFAGHICGRWVREILMGDWPGGDFLEIDDSFHELFQRWQINTHAISHPSRSVRVGEILVNLAEQKQSVIFQYDNVNTGLISNAIDYGCKNVSALFDLSHGAGILPKLWQAPIPDIPCGYAGGLSPENVADQLAILEGVAGDATIWIDAETRLRSGDDRTFDLDKVRAFLEAARPWVIAE